MHIHFFSKFFDLSSKRCGQKKKKKKKKSMFVQCICLSCIGLAASLLAESEKQVDMMKVFAGVPDGFSMDVGPRAKIQENLATCELRENYRLLRSCVFRFIIVIYHGHQL